MKNKILVPGSVLLDIYQDNGESYLGGACFNFACHVHNLIGQLDFISRIGKDQTGDKIMFELTNRHFPTTHIQVDPYRPTKTVIIEKDCNNEPNYIIASDVATEYLDYPCFTDQTVSDYKLIYFGTTIQSSVKSRSTVKKILDHNNALKFCDINLRPNKYTPQTIDYALKTCTVLKINKEELSVISNQYNLSGSKRALLTSLSSLFAIPVICLTLGNKGSLLYHNQKFIRKTITPLHALDTVGAGDAFSAILAVGLINKWSFNQTLDIASDFAAAICNIKGAVPGDNSFYNSWKSRIMTL